MLVKSGQGGLITLSFFVLFLFGFPNDVPSQSDYQGSTKAAILEGLKKLYEERKDEVTPEDYTRTKEFLTELRSYRSSKHNITIEAFLSETILNLRQNLSIGQPCLDTPHDKSIIKPPILSSENRISDKVKPPIDQEIKIYSREFRNYTRWRNRLLNSNQSFCVPLQGLECSSSKTCQCRFNSVWNSTSKKCGVPLGQYCPSVQGPVYLDIFKSSILPFHNFIETSFNSFNSFNLKCLEPYTCTSFDFFPAPICSKKNIHEHGYESFEFGDVSSIDSFTDYFFTKEIVSLQYGQDCDHSAFRNLVSASPFEDPLKRVMTLKTLKESKMLFCDYLSQALTCSQSNQCKCVHHMIYNNSTGKCEFIEDYSHCDDTVENFIQNVKNVTIVKPVFGYLYGVFRADNTKCSPKRKDNICRFYHYFQRGIRFYFESFCTCPDGKAGKNCDKKLTSLLSYIPTLSYAKDVDLNEKILLFDRLNDAAVLLESLLTQKVGESCDPNVPEIDIDGAIRFVRRLSERDYDTVAMTKAQYETTIQRMNRVNEGYNGKKVICNMKDFEQLRCDPVKSVCEYRPFNSLYKEMVQKLKDTSLKEGDTCTQSIETFEEVEQDETFRKAHKSIFNKLRDIWAVVNVDYCSKSAKLFCMKEDFGDDYGKCAYESKVEEPGKDENNTSTSGTVVQNSGAVPLTFYNVVLQGVLILFTTILY